MLNVRIWTFQREISVSLRVRKAGASIFFNIPRQKREDTRILRDRYDSDRIFIRGIFGAENNTS